MATITRNLHLTLWTDNLNGKLNKSWAQGKDTNNSNTWSGGKASLKHMTVGNPLPTLTPTSSFKSSIMITQQPSASPIKPPPPSPSPPSPFVSFLPCLTNPLLPLPFHLHSYLMKLHCFPSCPFHPLETPFLYHPAKPHPILLPLNIQATCHIHPFLPLPQWVSPPLLYPHASHTTLPCFHFITAFHLLCFPSPFAEANNEKRGIFNVDYLGSNEVDIALYALGDYGVLADVDCYCGIMLKYTDLLAEQKALEDKFHTWHSRSLTIHN
jgi:hypothetical protein